MAPWRSRMRPREWAATPITPAATSTGTLRRTTHPPRRASTPAGALAVQQGQQPSLGPGQDPLYLKKAGPDQLLLVSDEALGYELEAARQLGESRRQGGQLSSGGHGRQCYKALGHTSSVVESLDRRSPGRASICGSMAPMLERIDLRQRPRLGPKELAQILPAPKVVDDEAATEAVRAIIDQVRSAGDQALVELTERFDGVRLGSVAVPASERKAALEGLDPFLRQALEAAWENIVDYHRCQLAPDVDHSKAGIRVRELRRPVDRAGLYVPGGRAPLASTVLMTAGPARVAGVGELAICCPPGPAGLPAQAVLAAAEIAGVEEVYAIGGAQAIAAMAYGTETVGRVDVICGPGNRYVAIAERMVAGEGAVGVPSAFTGPSEVAVIADETANPTWAAVDLVVQAEHGPDGLSYLITWSEEVAQAVESEVRRLAGASERREEIEATLSRGGYAVIVADAEAALEVANVVAAEHLEVMTADPESLLGSIRSAGAVFLGSFAPASLGDYMAGPSHVLPTARSARFGSALGVSDFCRYIHVVQAERDGLARVAPHLEAIARSEGLAAHALSARLRIAQDGAEQ